MLILEMSRRWVNTSDGVFAVPKLFTRVFIINIIYLGGLSKHISYADIMKKMFCMIPFHFLREKKTECYSEYVIFFQDIFRENIPIFFYIIIEYFFHID